MMTVTVLCLCALCAVLVACGSGGSSESVSGSSAAGSASASGSATASAASSSATSAASASQSAASGQSAGALQPAANIDPAAIDPGSPDIWRLNGDASAEGIRFEKADNQAGLAFVRVLPSGEDGDGEFNLVITDDKHLRTSLGTAPKIDIVFYDNANCYDYVTGKWYSRA